MKNSERLKDYILDDIRKNVPFDRAEFTDEEIDKKTNRKLLDHYLNWNGIIGYTDTIINVIENIYNIELKEKGC
jgi:hypothetical protein